MAYVWKLFDVNVGLDQLVQAGGILCFSAKWLGEKDMFFYSEWKDGVEGMAKAAHDLLSEADAVVTYNGDHFDIPRLRGLFLELEFKDIPPVTSIDVYKAIKKLGFLSNKLAFVGPALAIGRKIKHEGFSLWTKVIEGDEKARARMERYCKQDVRLTELVYKRVKPFIKNHPHLGTTKGIECGSCGSKKLHSRGWRRTKSFRIQRVQCQDCGSWSDGKREKVK